jgi:hypothetical protein
MPLVNRTFDQLIDFTRTSAATFVNSSGNIASTPQSRNRFTFTQEFANSAWTKTNCQIAPNQNPAAASLGPELVTNGDFSSGTGWTVAPGGTGSITGGQAVITDSGAASNILLRQAVATVAGRLYRITYDVVSTNQSTAAYLGSVLGAVISGTGTRTFYLVAAANNVNLEIVCQAANGIVTIDNVSVREVIGGAIIAPDGTSTADKVIKNATTSAAFVGGFVSLVGTMTFSVYLKAAEQTNALVYIENSAFSGTGQTVVNLSTGGLTNSTTGTGVAILSSSATSVGNGWYRVALSVNVTSGTAVAPRVYSCDAAGNTSNAGDGVSGFFMWGAQIEASSTATDYTRNFGGLFPPRFDYNPVTLAPRGLLIEEQRTNLVLRSEEFDNASWVKSSSTVTANATTSPDGTVDAEKLIPSAASIDGRVVQTFTGSAGTTYTLSIYAKQGEFTNCRVYADDNATNTVSVSYNLATGAVSTAVAVAGGNWTSASSTITAAGNGWWRITLTWTATAVAPARAAFWCRDTGDGTSGIFVYGAQLEAGAFATSYIPTVASQVTRTADVASINAPNFASWYNQTEGTFVVEADSGGNVSAAPIYRVLSAGSGNDRNTLFMYNGKWGGSVAVGGVVQADLQVTGTYTANVPAKTAFAFKANDFAASVNGSAVLTDTSGTVPTVAALNLGSEGGAGCINGHIRSIRYYPTRLTNAQLQALTA